MRGRYADIMPRHFGLAVAAVRHCDRPSEQSAHHQARLPARGVLVAGTRQLVRLYDAPGGARNEFGQAALQVRADEHRIPRPPAVIPAYGPELQAFPALEELPVVGADFHVIGEGVTIGASFRRVQVDLPCAAA